MKTTSTTTTRWRPYPIDTGRLANVIRIAADKSGWKQKPGTQSPRIADQIEKQKPGERRGMGLAAHRSFLSYVATIVEVEVAADGTVAIPRVVMAVDAGTIVNPDRVKAQMEGACI